MAAKAIGPSEAERAIRARMIESLGTEDDPAPARFLSRSEVAEYLGLKGVNSLSRTKLPRPDVQIGNLKGWSSSTIDAWLKATGRRRYPPRVVRRSEHADGGGNPAG
jgi:predicted DNA-binding transcriptional regulator AlpA